MFSLEAAKDATGGGRLEIDVSQYTEAVGLAATLVE
jgi:hypothetical protein